MSRTVTATLNSVQTTEIQPTTAASVGFRRSLVSPFPWPGLVAADFVLSAPSWLIGYRSTEVTRYVPVASLGEENR